MDNEFTKTGRIKILGIDPSMNRTGVALTSMSEEDDHPHIELTKLISTPPIGQPTLLDQARKIKMVKEEIKKTIIHNAPINVVGVELHLFSRGSVSDSILIGIQHLIFNMFLSPEMKDTVVVPFPVMITPNQIKKWVDCSKRIKDKNGLNLKGWRLKQHLYNEIRNRYSLPEDMSGDELEAIVICNAMSAWAMPDSVFTKRLLPYQSEVVAKIKQQGETEIEGLPGFYDDNPSVD